MSGARPLPHITVCVCTFRRPAMIERLLAQLPAQVTGGTFTFGVVVADNDPFGSAREVVERGARTSAVPIIYTSEPIPNIARARNATLRHATGEYVAFIDDDEFPEADWLARLLEAIESVGATGVLGPVRPHFDVAPPRWVIDGGFCERKEHPTGYVLASVECRTGNVLLRRDRLAAEGEVFDETFRKGGEDTDFFQRMIEQGHEFRWCNEAAVYESVPAERLLPSYMLRRALLRGSLTMDLPGSHWKYLLRAVVAIPAYLLAIPVAALVTGGHAAMDYGIRLCDHLGVLMAACGLNPVRER